MAERRMFSKRIVESDRFIGMNVSARLLYYDLSMLADDDGFLSGNGRILRVIGARKKDIETLIEMEFLILFPSGVIAIRHWNVNNKVRKDMYRPTEFLKEKSMLIQNAAGVYEMK